MKGHQIRQLGSDTCEVSGCEKKKHVGKWCAMHRGRYYRTGRLDLARIQPVQLSEMTPVGLNITAVRAQHEMSHSALAKKAGVSHLTLHNVCRGRGVRLESLQAIAAALRVHDWELLKPGTFQLPKNLAERGTHSDHNS